MLAAARTASGSSPTTNPAGCVSGGSGRLRSQAPANRNQALIFCKPLKSDAMRSWSISRLSRILAFFAPLIIGLLSTGDCVYAQSIDIIRDTEIERVLHSYEDPILK